jgi:arylsulfatase A-like enzyme
MRGRATDALVSHVDLFPTFCDIAGVPKPDRLQGVSLLPLLEGRVDAVRQEVFAESTFHVTYDPMRAVRTKEYKLIKRFGELETPPAPNIGDQVTKDILRDRGYFGRRRPRVLLFDLVLDPVERVNLAEDPEYRAIRDELESKLEDWMRKTRDPLLDGPVHAPFPRALNDPTTYTNQPSPERKEEIRRIGAMWNRTEEWPTGKTPAD